MLLLFATQGLYAPAWLALNWRELKLDRPELRWNSVLHGAAWCPPLFTIAAGITPIPGLAWLVVNLTATAWRVREHSKVLATLSGDSAFAPTAALGAAIGYVVMNWLAIRELAGRNTVDAGHFFNVLLVVALAVVVVIPGQWRTNAHYDRYGGFEVRYRTHPLELVVIALGFLIQLANVTLI